MKQIRTARELYCELLKSFYFGIYQKDDQLMTYQETHEKYGLAKDTIGAAYAMLRSDGFIHTDGARGTIVTFDRQNLQHLAKVPLEWPGPVLEDTVPYEVAMRLHAHSLYTGLTHSGDVQLQACRAAVEDILARVKDGTPYYEQVFDFWMCVIASLDNRFLSRITDHFISRYLYLLPPSHLSHQQRRRIGESALHYYEYLLDAMDRRDFEDFPDQFERHYHNYYQSGGVVFSKLEDGAIFKEQALYGRLLEELCIKIVSHELQKGDPLPTTQRLCQEYGVSATTVNRAYRMLAELGLIHRHARSGTKLIAAPDDPAIWAMLEQAAGVDGQDWEEAVEAIVLIAGALSRRVAIPPEMVQTMREELERQRELFDRYGAPFSASVVLLSPLVASLPAGILHKYYAQLTDVMLKRTPLYTLRIRSSAAHSEEVYALMSDAVAALETGQRDLFAELSQRAIQRNAALLNEDYIRATQGAEDQNLVGGISP